MKPTIFTPEEEKVITQNLEQRLASYRKDGGPARSEKIIEDIYRKMNDDWDKYYRDRHKVEITSVINEFLTSKKDRLNEFLSGISSRFTKLTDEDKKDLILFDTCFSILQKTGRRKSNFRFCQILKKIERLKKCETIHLSRTDNNNIYKIAFRDNQEIMSWEPSHGMDIRKTDFYTSQKEETSGYPSRFTDTLSKKEARIIIEKGTFDGASADTIEFTKYLLN